MAFAASPSNKTTIMTTYNNHFEICSLIWLDDNPHETRDTEQKLSSIINHHIKFQNVKKCQEFIESKSNTDRLVMIVSGRLGREIVPLVCSKRQVMSIYVYCVDKEGNKQLAENYSKVRAVVTELDELVARIKADYKIQKMVEEPLSISFSKGSSIAEVDAQFLFYQVLIDCLLRLKSTEKDDLELIKCCTEIYRGNSIQLNKIDDFRKNYASSKALWWYTRESFFYKTLNGALRTQDIHLIFLFRAYIADIYRQLQKISANCPLCVYRSQMISSDELKRLKESCGQLISVNSFFSTSLNRGKALSFLDTTNDLKNVELVLFEIDADPKMMSTKPFANISACSAFKDEAEVLFMLGSIFRLISVNRSHDKKVSIIKMNFYGEDEHELKDVLEHMKQQLGQGETNLHILGNVLWRMGRFDLAEKYFVRLSTELPQNDPLNIYLYEDLAKITSQTRNYQQSLHWEQKLVELKKTLRIPSPNRDITSAKFRTENKDARTDSNIQESINRIRPIMKEIYELSEYTTPRYFFIIPAPHCDAQLTNSMQNLTQIHYKLYFLCECSHDPRQMHVAAHDGYSIKRPKEFVTNYASYLRVTLKILEILLHADGFVFSQFDYVSSSSTSERYNNLKRQLNLVENLINKFDNRDISASSSTGASIRIEQLRELEEYIERVDENGSLGNLYRTITSDGHVRWTCEQHYDEIGGDNNMEKYITVLKSMNGKFDKKTKEATVTGMKLSRHSITSLCEALSQGFNIVKLVVENCSISQSDLDKLLDIVINRSSIRWLCMKTLTVEVSKVPWASNYTCQCMTTDLSNQRMKVSFSSLNQEGNTLLLTRLLLKNKIHRQLSFEPNDILWNKSDLRRCLDEISTLRVLEIKHCNNADILNTIFGLKKNVTRCVKLSYSLNERGTFLSFCEMLKRNQLLNEIDLMNEEGFQDDISIERLLNTLKNHRSVKYLKLHIRNIQPSSRTETQLIQSLRSDEFISHLCISESVVSNELTESFISAIQYHKTLAHLKFYNSEMAAYNKAKLQSLYDSGSLKLLAFYEEPRWLLLRDQIKKESARVIPNLPFDARWEQEGVTVAGGNGQSGGKNQLNGPCGLFVDDDDDQTIVIADKDNHRIMQWKRGDTQGQVVAGGNGQGNRLDQLYWPTDVLIDKDTNSLIIADWQNRRVARWSRRSGTTQGEILIDNIKCYGLAMDERRNLYVSETEKNEVRRYEIDRGDKKGTVVAGGNGQGDGLNQLNWPRYLFVDRHQSLYVSDNENHRIMKWDTGAAEGVVVAGGQGNGSALTQLSSSRGIFVDTSGTVYVAEGGNHRVTRWSQGSEKQGTVVVGGNGCGSAVNQFHWPVALSFDKHANLYVADFHNYRVQRFNLIK